MSNLQIQIRGTTCAVSRLPEPLVRKVQRELTARRRQFSAVGGHIKWEDSLEVFWATNEEGELRFHIGFLKRVINILSDEGVTASPVWPQDRPEIQLSTGRRRSRLADTSELRSVLADHRRGQFVVGSEDEVIPIADRTIQLFPRANIAILCSNKHRCRTVVRRLQSRGHDAYLKSSEYETAPRVAVSLPRWYRPDQTDIVLVTDVSIANLQVYGVRGRLLQASRCVMSRDNASQVTWQMTPQRVYGFRSLQDDFGDRMEMRIEEVCGQPLNQPPPPVCNVRVEFLRCNGAEVGRYDAASVSRVTTVVGAIDNADVTQLRGLGLPTLAEEVGHAANLTMAVIVDSSRDGHALAEQLPGWSYVHCETAEQATRSRRDGASRRTGRPDRQIITTEALRRRVTSLEVDLVVWLGNGPCPGVVMAPERSERPVHVVDVVGVGGGHKVESTQCRTYEYARRGWAVSGDQRLGHFVPAISDTFTVTDNTMV